MILSDEKYYKYFWRAITAQFFVPFIFFTTMSESAFFGMVCLYVVLGLLAVYFAWHVPAKHRKDRLVQGIGISRTGWMISGFFGVLAAWLFRH